MSEVRPPSPCDMTLDAGPSDSPLATQQTACAKPPFVCLRYHVASPAHRAVTIPAALKMAVGANAPGHYVHKVITKLVDRLHAAKDWLVRPVAALYPLF